MPSLLDPGVLAAGPGVPERARYWFDSWLGHLFEDGPSPALGRSLGNPFSAPDWLSDHVLVPIWERFGQEAAAAGRPSSGSAASGASFGGDASLGSGGEPGVLAHKAAIEEASRLTGVPAAVIATIMDIESDGRWAVSPAGAVGPMQVMPVYHANRAGKYGESVYNVRGNILAGADYLKDLYDQVTRIYGVAGDEAWAIVAGAYLTGNPRWKLQNDRSADVFGTDAFKYSQMFLELLPRYKGATAQGAALGAPAGRVASTQLTGGRYAPVTQGFGRTEFAQTSNMYRDGFHMGYDLGVVTGTRITAPWEGVVEYAGDAGDGFGIKVVVRLGNGYRLLVGHLSRTQVAAGQRVGPGDLLGLSGNTGASTGPHLHVSILDPSGQWVDPSQFFVF